ncbi:MAG: GNAT family N-acetyltransferase, partial [Candidatus Promineifilaceae bacterium]
MRPADWLAVRAIYVQGIATRLATFETAPPEWPAWDQGHLAEPRLVIRQGDDVLGWAALSPVSGRCVYSGVAEVSVYVAENHRGQGLGKMLLQALVARSEAQGIWTLQAGIFPENKASIGLHLANGFRLVGIRERLGQLDGEWRDVALLERRSQLI